MRTDELTKILTEAASTVDARPGFTERVLEGGRRRRRRRLAMVAAALSTAAVLGFGTLTWQFLSRLPPDAVALDARFGQSALGGRAADEALRTEALEVFARDWPRSRLRSWYALKQSGTPQVELVGDPHVYWAGDTPAGPAVVLLHRAWVNGREVTLICLVGQDSRLPGTRLLGVHVPDKPEQRTALFQFGQDDRQLLGVGEGELTWSYFTLSDKGEINRTTQSTPVTGGIMLAALPTGAPPQQAQVSTPHHHASWQAGQLASTNTWHLDLRPENAVTTPDPPRDGRGSTRLGAKTMPEPKIREATLRSLAERALRDRHYFDPLATPEVPNWTLSTGLRDGRSLFLAELPTLGARPRVVGLVFDGDAAVETVVHTWAEPGEFPGAHLRLPGDEGWLLLTEKGNHLHWSAAADANVWQDAGTEGWAVVPPDTVMFSISANGRPQRTVFLN